MLPRDFVCWTLSGQLPYFELLAGPLMGDDAEFSTHLQLLQGYGEALGSKMPPHTFYDVC